MKLDIENIRTRNRISFNLTLVWGILLILAYPLDQIGYLFAEAMSTCLFWLSFFIACFLPLLEYYKYIRNVLGKKEASFICIVISHVPFVITMLYVILTLYLSGIGSHRL